MHEEWRPTLIILCLLLWEVGGEWVKKPLSKEKIRVVALMNC